MTHILQEYVSGGVVVVDHDDDDDDDNEGWLDDSSQGKFPGFMMTMMLIYVCVCVYIVIKKCSVILG